MIAAMGLGCTGGSFQLKPNINIVSIMRLVGSWSRVSENHSKKMNSSHELRKQISLLVRRSNSIGAKFQRPPFWKRCNFIGPKSKSLAVLAAKQSHWPEK
jgi:hypothetical protein